jgi:hypothetical protein
VVIESGRHETPARAGERSLGREHRDREIRKQAIFWLAESDDPRAAAFLDQLLED